MQNKQTFEELINELISKDPGLIKGLRAKIAEALSQVNLCELVASQISETIESVFENDEVYTMVETSIKQEIKKAITNHFRTRQT